MLVEKSDIQKYIPQRPPIVMVDVLLSQNNQRTTSGFLITAENIFYSNGVFTEAGIIENMAQTAALSAGYEAIQKNEKVKIGFIGAVKKLKIHQLPQINSSIETTISIMTSFGNVSIVKAEVLSDGLIIAEAEMSIFTQEEN